SVPIYLYLNNKLHERYHKTPREPSSSPLSSYLSHLPSKQPQDTNKMPAQEGGLKGFFYRAGASFYSGGIYVKEKSYMLASIAGKVGFVVATTSIAVLMPLIFEIMREGQMIEADKLQVKELRSQGYSDGQLQEMGFPKISLGLAPAVLKS
ncbi:hypothetical protein ACHAXN_002623, partial [Cyclotella atomus]